MCSLSKIEAGPPASIFDSRVVIDIVNLDKGFDNSDTGPRGSHPRTKLFWLRHEFGFWVVDSGESNPGPLGYGHDIISNRLCAHCQKLKPAHKTYEP